jgi:hypothetical protein
MRKKAILIGFLVLLPAAILSGASLVSCSDLACGAGTHEESGKCVSDLPSTCGEGTQSSGGACVVVPNVCGENTRWDGDASACVGTGGSGGDGGQGALVGGRWTGIKMNKPESIATIANLQLPPLFADGTFVIILRTEPLSSTAINLHGGDGVKMSDDPLMYTFKEGFNPTPAVVSTIGDPDTNDAGVAKIPFATAGDFQMNFQFVGNATDPQPPLYIWKAKITGTMDDQGVPTSNDPPLGGKMTGCFTAHGTTGKAGAADIYITLLSSTILELINSSGGSMDMDCTDSGSNDGFAFEIQWDSNETTALTLDLGDAGVAQQDAQ